ncbi:MAG: hypothetical protein GC146_03250 [Limimaricola sp.]|uniref:GMC family oxidoreductase N-terminal domain-containing protein n=1 Tax=Limimaricola sp. TaxID=2211665 RepID=UPI001D80619D|nr:GMC oxidoreductase [Limimaricola sp.]MBI1416216.1 hypothetical protein [Limimaricola sp.]
MRFSITRISTSLPAILKDRSSGPDLGQVFDAIVVGSGYGGAISAAKLALAGRKVLLLERGREILPGDYPRTLAEAQQETQITTAQAGRLTRVNGMLDLRINKDMSVVVGCGLGGTSLINANVSISPVEGVFTQTETGPDGKERHLWPKAFRVAADGTPIATPLAAEYAEAIAGLGAQPLPASKTFPKIEALKKAADELGYPFERPPINVTFADGKNHFGNFQPVCTDCGDCCSGCNYGAKNTTLMNYLPFAAANGAEIVTEAEVFTVAQEGGLWEVRINAFGQPAKDGFDVKAQLVVLAAGTLGSTEILKRSEAAGLKLASGALGLGFSGNGDVLGFGFDANRETDAAKAPSPIYSIGAGVNAPDQPQYAPGPCITGAIRIDMGPGDAVRDGVLIEEGVAPGPLSLIYPGIFFIQDAVNSNLMRFPDAQRRMEDIQNLGNDLLGMKDLSDLAYTGAVANTQSYLLMSHDDAGGKLCFNAQTDSIWVDWPGVGSRFPFPRDNDILRQASDTIWANYVANPLWDEAFGWKVISTHPVGGCRMADSAEDGVVNADCHVFTGTGDEVYDGLMVCDGAVIPSALGVNPLLTISAVTIRAMDRLIAKRNWPVTSSPKPAASTSPKVNLTPLEPAPFAALETALNYAAERLGQAILGIALGRGGTVKTELFDAARTFVKDHVSGWQQPIALGLINKAEKAADMKDDFLPAFETLKGYVTKIQGVLTGGGASSSDDVAAALLGVVEEIVGELSSGLSFSETMSGAVAQLPQRPHPVSDPYRIGAAQGAVEGATIEALFVVSTPDVDDMMKDPRHPTALGGSLVVAGTLPGLPAGTYTLSDGTFELLRQDDTEVDRWLMTYAGKFHDGLTFSGYKVLQRRPGSNWWTDLTTLNVDIFDASGSAGVPLARGQLTLGVQDFVRQSQTIRAAFNGALGEMGIFNKVIEAIEGHSLKTLVRSSDFLNGLARFGLKTYGTDAQGNLLPQANALAALADIDAPMLFATLIFEAYGGLPAYLYNYPARNVPAGAMPRPDGGTLPGFPEIKAQPLSETVAGATMQLTRFEGGKKGPVIVANGLGFRGLGFALINPTSKAPSFVQSLLKEGYDVWVFDHRASPQNVGTNGKVNIDYTIDQIAEVDWGWAIDTVLKARPDVKDVQVMAHCLGGLTAMMAVAGGHVRDIRQMIVSQFSLHPVTSWFNELKADTNLAALIRSGLDMTERVAIAQLTGNPLLGDLFEKREIFDLCSAVPPAGKRTKEQDLALLIDTLLWRAPFPAGEPCYSPTCHRVFGVFGQVYLHAQLDQFTHEAIGAMAGPVATRPFLQLGKMMRAGLAVDAGGRSATYMAHPERFTFPVHLISGSRNQLVTPDTTLRTQRWLQKGTPANAHLFTRQVFDGFGHLDCFIGRDAPAKVFGPLIDRLNAFN